MKNIEKKINSLLKVWDANILEHHFVLSFIKEHSLDYKNSLAIKEYLSNFRVDPNLLDTIKKLELSSIHDLVASFELLIPNIDKIRNGAFFTPSYIVDFIIKTIAPQNLHKNADISCGSGAFVVGLLKYYHETFGKSIEQTLKENIFAFDILEYNVRRSKIIASLYGLIKGEVINEKNIHIEQRNSLSYNWKSKFDNIVGNPPYVRVQDMDVETKKILQNGKWETTCFGSYNTYFAFFELGKKILNNSGKLGYITPNNYFTSLSGEVLRQYFQQKKCAYKIIDFNYTKVFNAQTYTAITFIDNLPHEGIDYAKLEDSRDPEIFLAKTKFTLNKYQNLNVKKWRLLTDDASEIIFKIENAGEKLGDLFNICAGIATLKDEVYIITPAAEKNGKYLVTMDNKNFWIEKKITMPLVKISDMKQQADIEANSKRIIFPYQLHNGTATIYSEDDLKKKFPACFSYLEQKKEILAGRGKGKQVFSPFYAYGRTQGLNRFNVQLFTPTFSKTPRFLRNHERDSLFTNGYGLYLKNQNNPLFTNPITDVQNIDVLQKILNSRLMHYYVKKTSVSIDGGYPCYQKNFIERFSIPQMSQNDIESIRSANDEFTVYQTLKKIYHIKKELPNLDL